MRSGSGEVQYDGFEYNWRFRPHKWTANVGKLGGGALVRRRRWVRLMMKPARAIEEKSGADGGGGLHTGRSINPSIVRTTSDVPNNVASLDVLDVWRGHDVEQDWTRCHALMKRLGRDGRKLELWRKWLSGYCSEHTQLGHLLRKGKQIQKEWIEDSGLLSSEVGWENKDRYVATERAPPVLEHVAAVISLQLSCLRATLYSILLYIPTHVLSSLSFWDTQDCCLR